MSRRLQDMLRYCESESAWVRKTVETLVRLESPSGEKAAVDRCGVAIAGLLTSIGADVTLSHQSRCGNHLVARWPGADSRDSGRRPILLLGHFDTVWALGTLDRMPIREQEGRLHGPGIFDMKSGIAVSMLAMRAFGETGGVRSPVSMLWTADEEVGSATSRALIEETARACRAVLVLEPSLPGGAAKTSRKGVGEFDLVVHGVAVHAGLDPGKGASAVHELARQILALETLQDPSRGITVNAGVIAGGTRPNVIADRASATIDVRVQTMEDAERVERAIRGLQPTRASIRLEIAGGVDRPPLERSPAVVRLYQQARDVAAALGRDLGEGAAGGGSDGNFTAALGVPTLDGLGPRGDGAHAAHEHVLVEDLTWRAAFLAGLVETLQ
ncbi:MAG TPA: M20 family metallopeptidase [Casimicrobiaceae bacterium]|nr:M20 family metallopeptidase [Casimicrobiaceae bacterium]